MIYRISSAHLLVGRKRVSECLKGEKNSMFTIEYAKGVAEDLKNIRAYERVQILDGIDKQLMHEPSVQTRNRKGQFSIRINDQFRICFKWTETGPVDVEITDYH